MNCDCHCNGKCKLLGGLEQQIMEVLWASPAALKPADVLKKLKGKHAYTTIMTVLKRMTDKKLVKRTAIANAFSYSPLLDKAAFASAALDDLFIRLFDSYGEYVLPSFKKSAKTSGFSL
jgi:predicted transcriptional regulator